MFGIQKRVMFGGAVAALLVVSGCIANEIPKSHSIGSDEAGSDKESGIRRLEDEMITLGPNYWYQFTSLKYSTHCLQKNRKNLKLAECNSADDRQKWHINDSGTIKNKRQYIGHLERTFCLTVDRNNGMSVRKCYDKDHIESGRQTFVNIRHGDATVRLEAEISRGGCVAVNGTKYENYYDDNCDDGNSHGFDVVTALHTHNSL